MATKYRRDWLWRSICRLTSLMGILSLAIASPHPAVAQITPDSTLGTESSVVTPNVNIRGLPADLIEGGATRGSALFHSFREFNVGELQRVYFANPTGIENIFSRVTGTDISDILGTLGVNGGANLFFLNPNGIIFGENARLDVAGSFVASTANSFVFGNCFQFSATNPEAPPLLTVNVTPGLQYGANPPGNITNVGNLTVGQNLTLAGGNLNLQGKVEAGGDLTLQALDTLQVRDSATHPFIAAAGGKLVVQGNEGVDIFALNHPDSGLFAHGDMILRSRNTVGGDAHYWSGGNFRIEKLDGSLGDLFSPYDPVIRSLGDVSFYAYEGASLHIFAAGKVEIPGYVWIFDSDPSDGLIETVTLSDGTSVSINGQNQATLDIRAGMNPTAVGSSGVTGVSGTFYDFFFNPISPILPGSATSADITIGYVQIDSPNGLVFLSNQYKPNTSLTGGDITITGVGFFGLGGIYASSLSGDGGSVILDSRSNITLDSDSFIETYSGSGNAGYVKLITQANINLSPKSFIDTSSDDGNAGNINLIANGDIILNPNSKIYSLSGSGNVGDINLIANGDITLNPLTTILSKGLLGDNITLNFQANNNITISGKISSLTPGVGIITQAGNDVVFDNSTFFSQGELQLIAGDDISLNKSIVSTTTFGIGNAGNLTVRAADSVTLSQDSEISSGVGTNATGNGGNLTIETGDLVLENGSQVSTSSFGTGNSGDLTVRASGSVAVSGDSFLSTKVSPTTTGDGGDLRIETGQLFLDNGSLSTNTFGLGNAGNLTIDTEKVFLQNRSAISTSTSGAGNAGNLIIQTGELVLQNSSAVSSSTFGAGNAGNLTIHAGDLVELSRRSILSSRVDDNATGDGGNLTIDTGRFLVQDSSQVLTSTFGVGDGGDLTIRAADSVEVNGNALLFTGVDKNATGDGGNLRIDTEKLVVQDGSRISSSTAGAGDAGNFTINASDSVLVSQGGIISAQVNESATGNGGIFTIETGRLMLHDGGSVSVATFGAGRAGTLTINASDAVEIFGGESSSGILADTTGSQPAGDITINTSRLILRDSAVVSTTTSGKGDAGNLTVNASDSVTVNGPGGLSSRVNEGATGSGGDLTINTGQLLVEKGGQIASGTFGDGQAGRLIINASDSIKLIGLGSGLLAQTESNGNANDLTIQTRQLIVQEGAGVSTGTFGAGNGGILSVTASDFVQLSGAHSGLFTSTEGVGDAGDLHINTGQLLVQDGALVSLRSKGSAVAGNLEITANSIKLDNQGKLTTESASGDGGNIILQIGDFLLLRHNSLISTSAGTAEAGGDGGNITINTPFILAIPQENSDITANAFTGRGGNINIDTQGLFGIQFRPQLTPLSDITASSKFGVNGTVEITTSIDPSRGLTQLPTNLVDPTRMIDRQCTARTTQSSFIITGRGGIPPSPTDSFNGEALVSDWTPIESKPQNQATSTTLTPTLTKPEQIVEAQGWVKTPDGKVFLVAQTPIVTPQGDGINPAQCNTF